MKTSLTDEQLADPAIAEADRILNTCQHFGFCTAGCPTYVLLHDENDGPRGRIDLIKEMLESQRAPTPRTVAHIDRCLSCMSCMTTCAVKVDYMHLVDTARAHIEENYRRPPGQRIVRGLLGLVLPRPALFRMALALGRLARPFSAALPSSLRSALRLIPERRRAGLRQYRYPALGERKWRVALLAGCVQPVLSPHINDATIRLLTRLGCEVVVPASAACCGSLNLHMGNRKQAREFAKANVRAWIAEIDGEGLDAILVNASGCGTTVKDYAHLLQDSDHAVAAARVSALALDITEWLMRMNPPDPPSPRRHRVAYHDACSLRNAQKVTDPPRALLRKAGYLVQDIPEAHFCCGSAGTYNLLQPDLARQLGQRKAMNIAGLAPQIIAAGNIGCITQIGQYSDAPIVHTVELLDWAYGGQRPSALEDITLEELPAPTTAEDGAPGTQASAVVRLHKKTKPDGDDVGIW